MNAKIRIPTIEYGFIELEIEGDSYAIVEMHDTFVNLVSDKEGLNQLEWAKVRDRYITTGQIEIEEYERLSKFQRYVINEIKKTLQRINRK